MSRVSPAKDREYDILNSFLLEVSESIHLLAGIVGWLFRLCLFRNPSTHNSINNNQTLLENGGIVLPVRL